jgi:hypothetical protein
MASYQGVSTNDAMLEKINFVICGHSLVGSHACGPPVFQVLTRYQISRLYLQPLRSFGSDTIKVHRSAS